MSVRSLSISQDVALRDDGSQSTSFQDGYVTTVFEVVRKCCPARLAHACGMPSTAGYIAQAIYALSLVEPDLELAVSLPINTNDISCMERMRRASWPKALGMRVYMPSDRATVRWDTCAALIVGHLCAL